MDYLYDMICLGIDATELLILPLSHNLYRRDRQHAGGEAEWDSKSITSA